ncbi:unnamed protein product, partial (macronuclear) [Paramecium tetraurelia]
MNAPHPEKMIEKFNQQMDVLLKHEELLAKQRKINEQKLNNIFDRNLQIETKDRKLQEQILSQRYQNEQLKIQQEKQKQLHDVQKQKKEKKTAQNEVWSSEQKQHEKEIQRRIFEIQNKLKYEEFKKKTDDLINQLDYNLRKVNIRYLEKQEKKERQVNEYMSLKQQTLNSSMQINESHNQNVYSNYQLQMKRIQEICQQKLKNYESKINKIYKQKYEKMDQLTQKVQQSQEHQELIKERSNQIFQTKIRKLKEKMDYFQDKINFIEKKRLSDLQNNYNKELEHHQQMNQVRAKSENIFRNKSLNLLNKQLLKEQTSKLVQHQNQLELEQKLLRLNQKQLTQQSQVMKADQFKQSYLQQLEQRISQR